VIFNWCRPQQFELSYFELGEFVHNGTLVEGSDDLKIHVAVSTLIAPETNQSNSPASSSLYCTVFQLEVRR